VPSLQIFKVVLCAVLRPVRGGRTEETPLLLPARDSAVQYSAVQSGNAFHSVGGKVGDGSDSHWLDCAVQTYGEEVVGDVKQVWCMCWRRVNRGMWVGVIHSRVFPSYRSKYLVYSLCIPVYAFSQLPKSKQYLFGFV
jgi:hypothetical protein